MLQVMKFKRKGWWGYKNITCRSRYELIRRRRAIIAAINSTVHAEDSGRWGEGKRRNRIRENSEG